MHATKVLQKILSAVIAGLDVRNARNLFFAVEALLVGRRLTLMELARHFPGAERVNAPLKRFDRLLGNRSVQAVRAAFYKDAAVWLLRSTQPVILVDWSEIKSDGKWHLLRAALSARGRALTLYEEVHPEGCKNHPEIEAQFLRRLQTLLPRKARPILITDAGFRVPWFRAAESHDWHWIGRVRGTTRLRFPGKYSSIGCRRLFGRATQRARSLGAVLLTDRNAFPCRLVLVKHRGGGRHHYRRRGHVRAHNGHSEKMASRMKEPWLLAVSASLVALSPAQVAKLYARRMQIEQSFRDLKSHRFGCAFEDTLTRRPERLEVLLLIHALATLAAWLEGLTVVTRTEPTPDNVATRRFHSITWIGFERLRRQHTVLSGSPTVAVTRLRQMLAEAV